MIPFLGMGTDQLAESKVGEPRTGDSVKFDGDDGFQTRWKGSKESCRAFSELVTTITVPSTSTSQKEKIKLVRHESTPYH